MPLARLLLDENIPRALAAALRRRGHDDVHVGELGLAGEADPEVLRVAVERESAVLTYDATDFLRLAKEYGERGDNHFGILLTAPRDLRDLRARALRLLVERTAESLRDAVVWLYE